MSTLLALAENRTITNNQGTTAIAYCVYDSEGNRIKSTVSGVTTAYLST